MTVQDELPPVGPADETDPSTSQSVADMDSEVDKDGHGHFRDLCVAYGDFYRPVFLQEFMDCFVRNANRTELAELKKAIAMRAAKPVKGKSKGRPRSEEDEGWLTKAKVVTWRRIVDGWTWWKIAESEGIKPTKSTIKVIERTLSRQVDQYAAIIWRACASAGIVPAESDTGTRIGTHLEERLKTRQFRLWLSQKTGLPFDRFPQRDLSDGCAKIVLELAPRGRKANAQELVRRVKYRARRTRS